MLIDKIMLQKISKNISLGNIKKSSHCFSTLFYDFKDQSSNKIDKVSLYKYFLSSTCGFLVNSLILESKISKEYASKIYNEFIENIHMSSDFDAMLYFSDNFIRELCSKVNYNLSKSRLSPINKVITYIDFNYMNNIGLCHLSSHVGLSPCYISSLFKKHRGECFKSYLNKVRVKNAKKLLIETNLNLSEIASLTGFENQNYFSTVFKKVACLTPNEFRKINTLNITNIESPRLK